MSGILSPCVYSPIIEYRHSEIELLRETNSWWNSTIRKLNISSRITLPPIPEGTRPEGLCLHTLNGHTGWVNSCAFSPDGTQIASASNDETVRLWDASTGKLLHILNGHTNAVNSCVFSPDGTQIASAASDRTVRLWNASTGKLLHTLNGHGEPVTSCAFNRDGTKIAAASSDQTVILWNVSTGEPLDTLQGPTEKGLPRFFSPDGTKEATAARTNDGTVRLSSTSTRELLYTLNGHKGPATSCAFSPDGTKIASTSHDNTVKVWLCAKSWWLNLLWNRLESNKQPWEMFTRIALSRIQKDLQILHDPQWEQYISSLLFQIAALPKSIDLSDRLRFLESSEAVSRSAILKEEEVAIAALFNYLASQQTPHSNAASTH